MTRRIRFAGLAFALFALAAGAWLRTPVLAWLRTTPERRALEEKVNTSRRTLTYPVTAERPLSIALVPQDTEVKILSNLEVDEKALAAAMKAAGGAPEFVYGFRIAYLDAAGRTLQSADYWERTTKTRVRDPGALVDREEAFFPDGGTTPCDTRATYVLVTDAIARGAATLRISLLRPAEEGAGPSAAAAPPRRVFLRCLRAIELTTEEAAKRWSKLSEDERERALAEVNLYKADLISEKERMDLMRRQWEVIAALADQGVEMPTVPVYFTRFFEDYEPPIDELVHAAIAGPFRALALNLVGPLNLGIEVFRDLEAPGGPPVGGAADGPPGPPLLEIVELREEGVSFRRRERLEAGPGGVARTPLLFPVREGPATIVCRPVNFRAHVRFHVDRANALEGSEVTRVVSPLTLEGGAAGGPGWLEVRPEVLSANYYDASGGAAGAGAPAVEAEVVHPRPRGEPGGSLRAEATEIRIAARIPIAPEGKSSKEATKPGLPPDRERSSLARAKGDPIPFSIDVELLAADGSTVSRRSLAGLAEPSLFDAYWREVEEQRLVSEPEYFTIRCPPTVRRVRVRAKERVDVAFYSRLPAAEDTTYVPEDYPKAAEIRVSEIVAGRLRPKVWFYYRPVNQFDLASSGREVRIEVQRRFFEERERAREAYEISNFARSLEPLAPPARFTVIEPAAVEKERLLLGRPASRFRIRPGTDERVFLQDPIDPGNPRPMPLFVRWAALGPAAPRESIAHVYVDGARAFEGPLAGDGSGALDAGAFPQGERAVRVEVYSRGRGEDAFKFDEAPRFAFFVDHPVRDGPKGAIRAFALHNEREAYPLSEEPLDFEVEKTGIEAVALNCVLFAPPVDGPPSATGPRDRVLVEVAEIVSRPGEPVRTALVGARTFSILRPAGEPALALDCDGRPSVFGPGERFFVALKTELDPGRYRVSFRRAPPAAGLGPPRPEPLLLRVAAVDPARAQISRTRFARLDLKGPLRLKVALEEAEAAALGTKEVRLLVKIVPGGPIEERIVKFVPGEEPAIALDLTAGLRTVVVGTLAAPLTVRFWIDRPADAIAGLYAVRMPPEVSERPWLEVLPHFEEEVATRIEARDGAGAPSWEIPAGAEDAPLRISTSVRLAEPSEVAPSGYRYAIEFRDREGHPLAAAAVTATALWTRAAFDRIEPEAAVSDEDEVFVVPPEGAASFAVVPSGTALYVSVGREVPAVAEAFTPEDYEREPGIRRTDFARIGARFEPIDPAGALRIAAAGNRRTLVRARARIREVVEPPPAEGFAEPLWPIEYGARSKILEPVESAEAQARAAGGRAFPGQPLAEPPPSVPSIFTPVRPGERVKFTVRDPANPTGPAGAAAAADVSVYYDFGGAPPSTEVAATVDGARAWAALPVAPHGRFALEAVSAGTREIAFSAPPGATFYVGAPPADPARGGLFRERVLTRIEAGRPLEIEIEKRDGRDVVLNGALYLATAPPPGAYVEVALAPGAARRRGVPVFETTRFFHRYHLGKAAPTRVLDLDRFEMADVYVFPFFAPLKADLPDGVYRVRVALFGAKEGAVRFLVLRAQAPVVERARAAVLRRD